MNTIIRAHVKNEQRLDGVKNEIISWERNGLRSFGDLIVVDDGSPLERELLDVCKENRVYYYRATGVPDTKNGLYNSMKVQGSFPVFCCVDDAVFGKGIYNRMDYLLGTELNVIPEYGLVGTFACYEDDTRNSNKVAGTQLWNIKHDILYALVAHVYSERLARIIIKEWEMVLDGASPYPGMCDDIWVATLLKKYNIQAYNTLQDFAQHTGVNNRTFGENAGSEYISKMFVGE